MEKDKIKFNYFYIMFQDIVRKEIVELEKNKIGDTAYDLSEIFDFYSNNQLTKEEKLNLLKVHIKKDNTFILYDELGNKIDSIDDEELINMVIKENLNR